MFVFKAAVVGAGVMGGEIAQVIASADIPVLLKDVDQKFVDAGLEKAREVTQGQAAKLVEKGKLTQEQADAQAEHTLGLITGTTDYDDFGDVDFVIEAVPEKMEIKHAVFADLDAATPGHAILASNTSGLSITEIGDDHQPARQGRRLPLLLAGVLHAADRGHRGRGHLAGDRPGRGQLRPGDPQDAGALRRVPGLRGQPHPRLDGVARSGATRTRPASTSRRSTSCSPSEAQMPMGPFRVADMIGPGHGAEGRAGHARRLRRPLLRPPRAWRSSSSRATSAPRAGRASMSTPETAPRSTSGSPSASS